MGFYVRKSIKAGPFRFNLSTSGLGVSAGVPGFRVGTGPRGNYVHVGRGGIYYRATLGGGSRHGQPRPPARGAGSSELYLPSDGIVMQDATGAAPSELIPTGPGDLVEQLNAACRRRRLAPVAVVAFLVVLLANGTAGAILFIPAAIGVWWLWQRDRARRSVVAFYDVNDEAERWFEDLVAAIERLSACNAVWRINAAGRVETTRQFKINAGASKVVSRSRVSISFGAPHALKTNIKVPTVHAGRQALAFLPDRVLAYERRRFADASYASLAVETYAQRFIEDERPPRDAQQVDTTWQFVNVKGGPDRRYKNNRQLPVMLYGRLELASGNGLFWVMDVSRPEAAQAAGEAISGAPTTLNVVHEPTPSGMPALPQATPAAN
jgi:hypothetical protein